MSETRNIVYELDGLAIGMAANSVGRRTVSDAAREIERLQSRIEELEQALKPFVNLLDEARSCHPSFDGNSDECVLEVFYGDDPSAFADIRFGDLRQARSVLEASNKGGKHNVR